MIRLPSLSQQYTVDDALAIIPEPECPCRRLAVGLTDSGGRRCVLANSYC
jgi:hypothetical protein